MGATQSQIHSLDTISKRVQFLAQSQPQKELFIFYAGKKRQSFTSERLLLLAGRFANRLRHQYGFRRNDVIANTLANSPERLITDLGITLAGCIGLHGQIVLTDGSDFFRAATVSRCNGCILRAEDDTPAWKLLKPYVTGDTQEGRRFQIKCDKAPDMRLGIPVSRKISGICKPFLEELEASNEDIFVEPDISSDDVLRVFPTSGSTGTYKLIPRTHAQIIDLWTPTMALDFGVNSVMYSDRPLGWVGGFPFGTYLNGDTRVLLDWFDGHGRRSGEDTWGAISAERCSIGVLLALDFEEVYRHVISLGDAHFKLPVMIAGGNPLKKAQLSKLFRIAERVTVMYGSTEASAISAAFITEPSEDFFCGKPVPGMSLRIVNDKGQNCKPREVGSVHIKGKSVFKGFFNRLEDQDQSVPACFTQDGWFNTDDTGFLDEDGNVYIIGRSKDAINFGSIVVYAGLLESKILNNPDIAEVCIVPVSDPALFHNICACVKPIAGSHLTEDSLKAFCEKIFLADLNSDETPMPKYFLVLQEFPKTSTGKTDKHTLTKMAEEKFGVK